MNHLTLGRLADAIGDLFQGLARSELWLALGWHDIRQRYRRSVAGPFWITISMAMMIGGIGYLSTGILNQKIDDSFPYLSAGIIVFSFMSTLINDGSTVFIEASRSILQIKAPLSIYIYQIVWRNILIFMHNITIFVVVAIIFQVNGGYALLLVPIGIFLIALNGFFVSFLLGGLGARFRDVPLIFANLMQVAFFLSPVFWKPSQAQHAFFVDFNPFYYFLEVVRRPLLGEVPPSSIWLVVIAITCVNATISMLFFARIRFRIAYWL